MGYNTEFSGEFGLDRHLEPKHFKYLAAFAETRRMARNAAKAAKHKDPLRLAVGLPIGSQGEYFVGGLLLDGEKECAGQTRTDDITDYNKPPLSQPGLWCKWAPNESGSAIIWDGREKFYDYTEWLEYLIDSFLKPWGYVLNGKVAWKGDEDEDIGCIWVKNNMVQAVVAEITYPEPDWPDMTTKVNSPVDAASDPDPVTSIAAIMDEE